MTPARLGRLARVLGAPLEVREPVAPLARLDAIVVLGAPLGPSGRISDIAAERARAAAALFHAGGAPIVCATGGATAPHAESEPTEADAIADELRVYGVPGAAIRIERASRTTAENAAFAAALLADDGVHAVWLVTQPFHARRARWLFRRAGFDAHVWHIADSLQYERPARALRWIVREYGAMVANGLGALRR